MTEVTDYIKSKNKRSRLDKIMLSIIDYMEDSGHSPHNIEKVIVSFSCVLAEVTHDKTMQLIQDINSNACRINDQT